LRVGPSAAIASAASTVGVSRRQSSIDAAIGWMVLKVPPAAWTALPRRNASPSRFM